MSDEKAKNKPPTFLIAFLVAKVAVLILVGYLAYAYI